MRNYLRSRTNAVNEIEIANRAAMIEGHSENAEVSPTANSGESSPGLSTTATSATATATTATATATAATQAEDSESQSELSEGERKYPNGQDPRLRYQKPYWWPYKTFVKERWIGRELLEVISTEFRDRSVEYYRHALESGVTKVNGYIASPDLVLRNGDRLDNTVHRHEPPVTNDPILILHIDREKGFVMVSKPGSVPVHPTGRYYRHTVLEMMESDHGIKCFSVNRLDRLTSGLMILALSSASSRDLAMEFVEGRIRKEYVARVKGKFPEEEVIVDKPLLTVDRQMGLVIVTPEGKEARTRFRRMSYDPIRDQSVVHCRPLTGRTHQIRVHLQYIGHPIANDPLYSHSSIWGSDLGRGGVDLEPDQSALALSDALASRVISTNTSQAQTPLSTEGEAGVRSLAGGAEDDLVKRAAGKADLNDREFVNIDITSPIRLSSQARMIIAKLRRAKDEQEDWVKWKEVVFRAKEAQDAHDVAHPSTENEQKRPHPRLSSKRDGKPNKTREKQPSPQPLLEDHISPLRRPDYLPPGFCQDCYVPVPDDPDPETLFIYLHALRYTTPKLGAWATPLPRWAEDGWGGDWRGWSDQPPPEPFPEEGKEEDAA